MTNTGVLKRYNLVLPEELFNEVQQIADKEHITVLEVLRRFIKLGLLASKIQDDPDSALYIREGNSERKIIFL